jgi:hypothetical protein
LLEELQRLYQILFYLFFLVLDKNNRESQPSTITVPVVEQPLPQTSEKMGMHDCFGCNFQQQVHHICVYPVAYAAHN